MGKKVKADWCVMDGPVMVCTRCGERHEVKLPMEVRAFCRATDGFIRLHSDCAEQTIATPAPASPEQQNKTKQGVIE